MLRLSVSPSGPEALPGRRPVPRFALCMALGTWLPQLRFTVSPIRRFTDTSYLCTLLAFAE